MIGTKSSISTNMISKIIALAITTLVTLLITRIVVEKLSGNGYGYYQMSNDFVNYAQILTIALNSMASRFIIISYCNNNQKATNQYINSILVGNIFLSIGLAIPMLIIVLNLSKLIVIPEELVIDVKILFSLMFVNFLITIITSVFGTATYANDRLDLDGYRDIGKEVIKLLLVLVAYAVFKPKIWYLGAIAVICTAYNFLVNIRFTKKLLPDISIAPKTYFDYKKIIEVCKSGVWNCFTKLSAILLTGVDLLLANNLVSTYAMGVISVAKTIPKLIITSISTLASVFSPRIMMSYATNEKEKLVSTIDSSVRITSVFAVSIQSILLVLGKSVFDVWVPEMDSSLLQLVSVIAIIGYLVLMPFEVFWCVFTATNKVKISSVYLMIESIIVVGIELVLLSIVDSEQSKMLIIVGVSSLFEMVRAIVFLPIFSAKCLELKWTVFYGVLFRVIVAYGAVLAILISLSFVVDLHNWAELIVFGAAFGIVSIVISGMILLNKNERVAIYNATRNKLLRKGEIVD